jgi:hypothetical protein
MPVGGGKPAGGYRAGKKGSYGCKGYPTVSADGTVHGCHPTKAAAAQQARAIWASVNSKKADDVLPPLEDFMEEPMLDKSIFANSRSGKPQKLSELFKRDRSMETRRRLAESGEAMPDGSYPIVTIEDLRNAIQAFGRSDDPRATKEHIKRRARALGRTDLLPENWK